MIITLTPNPAVDQTMWIDRLHLGLRNRYWKSDLDPAGKGVNVSRMAHRLGWPTMAFGFLGGEMGTLVERALEAEGVPHHFVRVPGQTRINVMIIDEASGEETNLHGPGPLAPRERQATLMRMIQPWLRAARVLVLAGSLPPGMPQDAYAALIRQARAAGVRTILNTAGEPLRLGVQAAPDVVKANVDEIEELLGRPLPDVAAAVRGAQELMAQGVGAVFMAVGPQGTLAVQGGRAWWALPPEVPQRSRVGAGDSLVAGLAVALARGDDIVAGLRLGAAAGAATVLTPGTSLGSAEQVTALMPQVQVHEITGQAPPAAAVAQPAPAPPSEGRMPALLFAAEEGLPERLRYLLERGVLPRRLEPRKRAVLPRERLRYGMDIDGTITRAPRHFKRLIDALLDAGDHVYIVTGRLERDRPETEALLSSLGIQYNELLMRPNNWRRSIADYKVHAVRERGLHLLMDDDPRNCWAVIRRTEALAGQMLPIPETAEARHNP
ncbi:MAG TPA: hexose kinase [Anaerolineae bacterium]|nr:hexose kinase [Anaerolineae bacterium]HPL26595.1 hexose kinase [Anaerolineae bacterium]